MAMRILRLDAHVGPRRAYPRTIRSAEVQLVPLDAQQRKLFAEPAGIDPDADQRAEDHVAARAREAVEV
jgi:hypothetical protein